MRVWERLHRLRRCVMARGGQLDEHDNLVLIELLAEVHDLQAFKLKHDDAAREAHAAAERAERLSQHQNVVDLLQRSRAGRRAPRLGGAA